MVPWVLSRSLHPSALVCECMCVRVFVCVYVCVCVCMCVSSWFKVSSMTPITSAPLGSFFPLLPQLSPGSLPRCPYTPAHTQGLLGDAPPPDQLL